MLLTDILIIPCTALDEASMQLLGERFALGLGHASGSISFGDVTVYFHALSSAPLARQVTLLTDNDTGHLFLPGKVENLVMHSLNHFKRLSRVYRVHQHIAVNADGVL